jgi:hypothetical protein
MTEAEWLAANDPTEMLEELGTAYKRKLRLFACACCRRVWSHLQDSRSKLSVEASEQFADREIGKPELKAAQLAAMLGKSRIDEYVFPAENAAASVARPNVVTRWVAQLTCWAIGNRSATTYAVSQGVLSVVQKREIAQQREAQYQAFLLRDIFGNPFRPIQFDPAWFTPTVVALANGIYADRAFDRMPILADALEEAGCDNADVLLHCRGDSPHVKGCWVVDAVLGKE